MKTPIRFLVFAFIVSLGPAAWATAIFALTTNNEILVVNAAVPQEILSIKAVSGLAPDENLLGIDVRPATGQLYALSDGARLFTIDPNSAAATLVGPLAADPADLTNPFTALSGNRFSIDFNPVPDRLRVVSDSEQNLRINPNNASVTTDAALAYDAADVSAGVNPNIGGIAYNNNVAGASTTTFFGIDDQALQIVVQNPPNNGTLNSQASFGLVDAKHVGFDIAPDGTAFVAGRHEVPSHPIEYVLVTVDPLTGAGESRGVIGDGTIAIRDIAVATSVAFSAPHYAMSENGTTATITVKRDGFLNTAISVQYNTLTFSSSATGLGLR
jgi:hypothetical protein